MMTVDAIAEQVISRCRLLAQFSEEPGITTRTFLSEPMRAVHANLRDWMEQVGMRVSIDCAGNLRGVYGPNARTLFIASHLDTVPRAGAFDGVLGVVLGLALVELLDRRRLPFTIEVIGFSEEEGVRFSVPFIGSRAFIGDVDQQLLNRRDAAGISVREAITAFGLDPDRIGEAQASADALGYLEFHIEQGPVLDNLNLPLAIVETISGQSRLTVRFEGAANHAGTTPMNLRRDALTGAAEWTGTVELEVRGVDFAVATVGRLDVSPGAGNVIPGSAVCTLDLRHESDAVRHDLVTRLSRCAELIATRRGLTVSFQPLLDQPSVPMDPALVDLLEHAIEMSGLPLHRMSSGAGHDAMIVARRIPAAMLFLRTPGGISHHPDETVLAGDVADALQVGLKFLELVERRHA